jgi:pimeloyl-ACP methyl ester carboxylesterase
MNRRTTAPDIRRVASDDWIATGTRRPYDPATGRILTAPADPGNALHVWDHTVAGTAPVDGRWITMLPGFPDGSYGWAQVDARLQQMSDPRLYIEYLGHGDSDKPRDYRYSTTERADLVAAQWRFHQVRETFIVAFDYSTLVVLELLARRLDGDTGQPKINGILLANGGLFIDAHSHPWQTTPFMKTRAGRIVGLAQYSEPTFRVILRAARMYSKQYTISRDEQHDWFKIMARRNGMFILHADAGFVSAHRAAGDRLDFARLFRAFRGEIPFHVSGATNDAFEGRQTVAARDRLGHEGLDVRFHPGGHLTTHEHPGLLADSIRELTTTARP